MQVLKFDSDSQPVTVPGNMGGKVFVAIEDIRHAIDAELYVSVSNTDAIGSCMETSDDLFYNPIEGNTIVQSNEDFHGLNWKSETAPSEKNTGTRENGSDFDNSIGEEEHLEDAHLDL